MCTGCPYKKTHAPLFPCRLKLLRKKCLVMADNTLFPGAPVFGYYLAHSRLYSHHGVCRIPTTVHGVTVEDWLLSAQYRGDEGAPGTEGGVPPPHPGGGRLHGVPGLPGVPYELTAMRAEIEAISARSQKSRVCGADWREHQKVRVPAFRFVLFFLVFFPLLGCMRVTCATRTSA